MCHRFSFQPGIHKPYVFDVWGRRSSCVDQATTSILNPYACQIVVVSFVVVVPRNGEQASQ